MVPGIKVSGIQRTGTNFLRHLIQKNVIDCTVLTEDSFDISHTTVPIGHRNGGKFFDRGKVANLFPPLEAEGVKLDSFLWLFCTKHPYSWLASSIKYREFNKTGGFYKLSDTGQADGISKMLSKYMSYLKYVHMAIDQKLVSYVRYEDILNDWQLVLRDIGERYSIDMLSPLLPYVPERGLPGGSLDTFEVYRVRYLEDKIYMEDIANWKEPIDTETDWKLANNFAYSKHE